MFNINYKDYGFLLYMQEAIGKISRYAAPFANVDAFFADGAMYDAVLMNFIFIGELAAKISDELRDATEGSIDWFKIKGFRNVIAHDYLNVDANDVWKIIQEDLPQLQRQLEKLLK